MTSVTEAIGLIDALIGTPTREQTERQRSDMALMRLHSLGLTEAEMGGVATKGCGKCGQTMYWTRDKDGNQWICSSCGHIE